MPRKTIFAVVASGVCALSMLGATTSAAIAAPTESRDSATSMRPAQAATPKVALADAIAGSMRDATTLETDAQRKAWLNSIGVDTPGAIKNVDCFGLQGRDLSSHPTWEVRYNVTIKPSVAKSNVKLLKVTWDETGKYAASLSDDERHGPLEMTKSPKLLFGDATDAAAKFAQEQKWKAATPDADNAWLRVGKWDPVEMGGNPGYEVHLSQHQSPDESKIVVVDAITGVVYDLSPEPESR